MEPYIALTDKAWFDFLVNLPVYKGKCSYKYVEGVDLDDDDSPFAIYRQFQPDSQEDVIRNHIGWVELTVSLASLPVQMTFSLLSMVRYCRDYTYIVKNFDLMCGKGLHPYLSFVLAQQALTEYLIGDKICIMTPNGGAIGHHSLRAFSAMSVDLLKILYHEDYSGMSDEATTEPYSVMHTIPGSMIRFMEPGKDRLFTLEKQLRLVEDGVIERGKDKEPDHYGRILREPDYLVVGNLRINDLNRCIEKMIAGEVTTAMDATSENSLQVHLKAKKARKHAKHIAKAQAKKALRSIGAIKLRTWIVGTDMFGVPIRRPQIGTQGFFPHIKSTAIRSLLNVQANLNTGRPKLYQTLSSVRQGNNELQSTFISHQAEQPRRLYGRC